MSNVDLHSSHTPAAEPQSPDFENGAIPQQTTPLDSIDSSGSPSTASSKPKTLWLTPDVDIYDHSNHYILFADLPGVHERDVELEFEGETLALVAQVNRTDPTPMLHREYRVGSYRRRFRLADSVDLDQAQAHLESGVLSVKLPKTRVTQRRQITINGAS